MTTETRRRWTLFAAALLTLGLHQARADTPASKQGEPELRHAWEQVMWTFRSQADRQAYLSERVYARAPLHGVKVDGKGQVYVSTARLLDARVPATLNKLVRRGGQTLLQPYPNWAAHRLGAPGALRNVLGFHIDSQERMWILDMGFVAGDQAPPRDTEQKIVVWDIARQRELMRLPIPAEVADPRTAFLNDLALDEARQVLYISDTGLRASGGAAGGILVYDVASRRVRRVLHRAPSTTNDPERPLYVNGELALPKSPLQAGINGIALSPDGQTLYWALTTGDALYRIPTRHLRDPNLSDTALSALVEGPLRIGGGADGLGIDQEGRVYITNLTLNQVQVLDPAHNTLSVLASGPGFIWPDTLGWDRQGGLWVSTNQLHRVFAGEARFDKGEPLFRLYRIQTTTQAGHAKGARSGP